MSGRRMAFEATVTVQPNLHSSIKVTAVPLADDVTPDELYEAEARLIRKVGEAWIQVFTAIGAEVAVTKQPTIIKDHEEAGEGASGS